MPTNCGENASNMPQAEEIQSANDGRLKEKFERLVEWFRTQGKAIVALSGGVDSALLAYAAFKALRGNAVAVTAQYEAIPKDDLDDARTVARTIGIRHRLVNQKSLSNPHYLQNLSDRCYACRRDLVAELKRIAEQERARIVATGTVVDDLSDYRPGLKALDEAGVRSPLVELGFSKNEVRKLAKLLRLPNADKPSNPCLSSRIAYGQKITPAKLSRIELAETMIKELTGAKQVRVRDHGEIARVELERAERKLFFKEKVMDTVAMRLKALGFKFVALELEGYRSGSMNALIGKDRACEERNNML